MIKGKLSNTGKDIFTMISDLTKGSDIINLAQGYPDFACRDELKDLAIKYIRDDYNQYAHPDGVMELREAIVDQLVQRFGVNMDPVSEVTITAGAGQSIYTVISSFISEGDEVVLFEPTYSSYISAIESNGGRPVFVQLQYPDYSIDWEAVQKIITSRTRLIIVNTPHNPTGAIFTANDLAQLQKITNGTKINILSDEAFEHIVYGPQKHVSVLSNPTLAERSIVVSSFSKTFHVAGWKIGYCLAPEKLTSLIRRKQQFQINSVNTPLQYALAEYLRNGFDPGELLRDFEENRQLMIRLFDPLPFEMTPTPSTYFQLLSYKPLSDLKDSEFAHKVMEDVGVALFPMSVFYHDAVDHKMVGLNFALDKELLIKAADRLKKLK
ncbi:MAG: methionine aminotransferase [Bacteroidales bacterium]|jgi:methionine aminotransferase|nr:methionine aminotransferase [Bacteroidales bacterium]